MRMQLKGMRLPEAKKYVADKLGINIVDLADCSVMQEIRQDLGLGYSMPADGDAKGIQAKFNIARVLDIKINSVEKFKEIIGLKD